MARSVKRQLEQAGFSQGWEQIKKQEESSLRTRIWAQDEIAITHPQHATPTEPPVLDEERTVEAAIHQPPVQAPPAHTKEAPLEEGESAGFFFRLREKWYQHRIGVQGDVHMCAKIICQRQHTG